MEVYCEDEKKKIIVHCRLFFVFFSELFCNPLVYIHISILNKFSSAGVGRTGTLVALFNLTLLLNKYFLKIKEYFGDSNLNQSNQSNFN